MTKVASLLMKDDVTFDVLKAESDVISTACILGFVATRYYLDQPCSFEIEYPDEKDRNEAFAKDWFDFELAMSAMGRALDIYEPGMSRSLKDGQSPEGGPGKRITGSPGAEMTERKERERKIRSKTVEKLAALIQEKGAGIDGIYRGRGAYSGVYDNPVLPNKPCVVTPTIRVVDKGREKWKSGTVVAHHRDEESTHFTYPGAEDCKWWGLIAPFKPTGDGVEAGHLRVNLGPIDRGGMGPIPKTAGAGPESAKVGYVHGMCSAIQGCLDEGSWCTPFEIATGDLTTKMASCFACCTYMHAAGYPPSSTHLGRNESWVPPGRLIPRAEEEEKPKKETDANGTYYLAAEEETSHYDHEGNSCEEGEACFCVTNDLNRYARRDHAAVWAKWSSDIRSYIELGSGILARVFERKQLNHKSGYLHCPIFDLVGAEESRAYIAAYAKYKAAADALKGLVGEWKEERDANSERTRAKAAAHLFLDAITLHDSEQKKILRVLRPLADWDLLAQMALPAGHDIREMTIVERYVQYATASKDTVDLEELMAEFRERVSP